jgi:TonB family protein
MALKKTARPRKKFKMKPITIMLILSVCIHLAVLSLLAVVPWFSRRKIHVPVYPVTLVTQAAPKPTPPKPEVKITKKPTPKPPKKATKKPVEVKKKKPKPKKRIVVKRRPVKKDILSEKRVQRRMESTIERLRKKLENEEKPKASEEVAPIAPKPSRAVIDRKLKTYYHSLWRRIQEEWILPPSLLEEIEDPETVIVIKVRRDGSIVESWFEEKSGSPMYDESAMRAIKKANPLPPFPEELEEDILEVGIRFNPRGVFY